MSYERIKITTDKLELGMYVSDLDRSWEGTPFLMQGLYIKTSDEIKILQRLCKHVFIDIRHDLSAQKTHDRSTGSLNLNPGDATLNEKLPLPKAQVNYTEKTTVEQEFKTAIINHDNLSGRFKKLFTPFKSVKDLEFEVLEAPIADMVDSIIRNPNALVRLTMLKGRDNYTYNHCINMSILAVSFGRHLGLGKGDLNTLAWGAMFCDFGKAMVPPELLNKAGRLADEEFRMVKRHILFSIEAVQAMEGFSKEALEMIRHHHERYNGSGYPNGLKGKQIPIFSRMAGIVDTYDAIISDRPYARAISPHQAIQELYDLRDVAFQPELIEAFIQAIGVYPIGTLVELSTGQVGVVIAQNKVRHLKPKIMLILDQDKIAYKISPILDLMHESIDKGGNQITISNVLEPNSFGIKPEAI